MEKLSNIISFFKSSGIFRTAELLSEQLQTEVYVVGGYVRDQFLGRQSKDIDFLVIGDGLAFAQAYAAKLGKGATLSVFKNFGTAHIQYKHFNLEFVGARKESYLRDSRKPKVQQGSLTDDLSRRDFTINALAISLNPHNYGHLVDLFNGMDDMKKKIIRTPLEPDKTYSDDPLRMMRAIRFATQLDFEMDKQTFDAINRNVDRLGIISFERISDELNNIMMATRPSTGFFMMHDTGILDYILPELIELKGTETVNNKSHKDNFYHTLKVLDNIALLSDDLWLRWAALLHDIGKPLTKYFDSNAGWTFHGHEIAGSKMVTQVFRRLKLPLHHKMKYVKKLVYLHLRPVALTKEEITDSAVRRLIVDAGDDIEDLLLLCKADITSKHQDKVKQYISRFDMVHQNIIEVTEKDRLRNWKNPVTGELIMQTFDIKPSKQVGLIKERIKEAILEGEISNDFDAAYDLMIKIAKEYNLKAVNKSK